MTTQTKIAKLLSVRSQLRKEMAYHKSKVGATHHDARADRNAPSTIRVRNNISKANAQESDRYQPHSIKQVCVFFIVEPVTNYPGEEA